jgi:hypothetical protein
MLRRRPDEAYRELGGLAGCMRRPLRRSSLSVFLIGFFLCAASSSHAQDSRPPECSAKQLDVNLVSPTDFATESDAHWLSVEFQNRESTACVLIPLMAKFGDSNPTTIEFAGSQRISGGGVAHVLLVWSSAPIQPGGITMYDCTTHETVTIFSESVPATNPLLEIQHLSMRSCGKAWTYPFWTSSYRPGPYVAGEPISQDWLDRFHLELPDFSREKPLESLGLNADVPPAAQLRVVSDVEYLKRLPVGYVGYFELFLKVSVPAKANCPFSSLRKREADGATIIYLNHCGDFSRNATSPPAPKESRLMIRELGLLPERAGRVQYNVTSEVLQNGKPALAHAGIDLSIRDPQLPTLPEIDTNIPQCLISQLRITSPVVELGRHWGQPRNNAPLGEEWQDGKVFEVTNVSAKNCMLGGVPELKFLNPPEVKTGGLSPEVCLNCANSLFKPRESRWIDLKPNNSAHIIVVRTAFDSDHDFLCAVIGDLEMSLPGDKQSMRLPFEVGSCGPVRESAWRAGRYDGDPMNINYDREETEHEQRRATAGIPLPPECTPDLSADTGKPVIFRHLGSLIWGLSTKPVPYGENIFMLLWVCNTTDKPLPVMTCEDIDRFWLDGLDVFDSSGHRVLSRREENDKKLRDSNKFAPGGCFFSCTRNFPINIPAHSCLHASFSNPNYDFVRDIRTYYSLPPGRYAIVPSERNKDCEPSRRTLPDPKNGLLIVVAEP